VVRLFPASPVVPRSLVLAADAHAFAGRLDVALGNLMRVLAEYPRDLAAADAGISAGRVFLSMGDPISALEQLQQVRTEFPEGPAAGQALSRLTILHRLYVRAPRGPAFVLGAEPVGPARLRDVRALARARDGALYWASEQTTGVVLPAAARLPTPGGRPRNLTVDAAGNVIVVEAAALRPLSGAPMALNVARATGAQEALRSADTAVQISNGDWLVMDDTERGIQRFSRAGAYIGPFAVAKAAKLAVNEHDEIAGLDRDQKAVVLYDTTGKVTGRVPLRGVGFELSNPVDLAYDVFGHLYVLDRERIAVFSPYPAPAAAPAPPVAGRPQPAPAAASSPYRLVTVFAEPQTNQNGLRRATAFALDPSGTIYVYDERAERVLVYR
jgi:hypothetical protein